MVRQLDSIKALTSDASSVTPYAGVGYSNAALMRVLRPGDAGVARPFVLKCTVLKEDWTACLTGDVVGREALLLGEHALAPIWDVITCPYVAFAFGEGETGLLMDDLTEWLLPDVRAPLDDRQEIALLDALAHLHARFWKAPLSSISWLMPPSRYCDLLGPAVALDPRAVALLSPVLRENVPRGWTSALSKLPERIAFQLTRPGHEWQQAWADLPQTLLHGDVKVANFAITADGKVAAFDWAMCGAGPCAIDLGWYLAVNATRLTGSKEAAIIRYRGLLERALGTALENALWSRLESVAVISGARMLLWSKALARDAGRADAEAEWTWWIDRLAQCSSAA